MGAVIANAQFQTLVIWVISPQVADTLEQVREAIGNGVRFDWLTFDEEYGSVAEF